MGPEDMQGYMQFLQQMAAQRGNGMGGGSGQLYGMDNRGDIAPQQPQWQQGQDPRRMMMQRMMMQRMMGQGGGGGGGMRMPMRHPQRPMGSYRDMLGQGMPQGLGQGMPPMRPGGMGGGGGFPGPAGPPPPMPPPQMQEEQPQMQMPEKLAVEPQQGMPLRQTQIGGSPAMSGARGNMAEYMNFMRRRQPGGGGY